MDKKQLQNDVELYKNQMSIPWQRMYYAIGVLREFRRAHGLSISELAEYLKLSRSTTQRLCQYGVHLKYNAKTWDKVFAFVENLPPIQQNLL